MNELASAKTIASKNSPTSSIQPRMIGFGVIATIILYGGMATLADWNAIIAAISALPRSLWVSLILLSLTSYLLRFARWNCFMMTLGYKLPRLPNLEIYLAGFALTLTPGKIGEITRSVYLLKHGVGYPHSIAAFVSERFLDLAVVAALASFSISTFPNSTLWALGSFFFIVTLFLFFNSTPFEWLTKKISKNLVIENTTKIVSSIHYLLSIRRLSMPVLLSLLAWTAQGTSLYLIVNAMNYELTIHATVSIYCLSILAGAMSFIPGGVGATEIAITLLLLHNGISQADAITASLITRGATLWLAVSLGILATTKTTFSSSLKT